jgi:hypothetical protein
MENKELELTDEMISRNDEIDNAVYKCICILAEKELPWDMELIADCTDTIKEAMYKHKLTFRHPGVITDDDGSQRYSEYDDELVLPVSGITVTVQVGK